MEHQHILPSSYPLYHHSLDDHSSRHRQPLADSAGNAQLHTLASTGHFQNSKGHNPRDRPMYTGPTLPSQPRQSNHTLEQRRQSTRRQRASRYSRNPILDSPQYQAYRSRATREGNAEDQKWPEILEVAFLDALIAMPIMGRRKFSFKGKPHGRNELISKYLWIAYRQSLPPGAIPDPSMLRLRKQVSSHIQVLKGFMRGHPAFSRLFPDKKQPKNGFEDSFANNPCLIALSEDRLPSKKYYNHEQMQTEAPMRPALFWLLITSASGPRGYQGQPMDEDMLNEGNLVHRFTSLGAHRQPDSLESFPNWRQRFPYLQQLHINNELACDIIHMDVSLNLLVTPPPEGTELCCRTILSIPGRRPDDSEWRTVTTLNKPPELYRDAISDPPLEAEIFLANITSVSDVETRIKIPFPAAAFLCLGSLRAHYDEKAQSFGGPSARESIEQMSMYQEVQSAAGPRQSFTRRAIILWTFHQAREDEGNSTTWQYLEAPQVPARRMCMSPSPHPSHQVTAAMNENFNAWSDVPLHLQHPTQMLDPFAVPSSMAPITPPHTAGLQSPPGMPLPGFGYASHSFDLPDENLGRLSFVSNTTMDSESTLVDDNTATNIDNFLSNASVHLGDFDHSQNHWQLLPASESFDADPAWATYSMASSTPAIGAWDGGSKTPAHAWHDQLSPHEKMWDTQGATAEKHEWLNSGSSPIKPDGTLNYIEQSLEAKLLAFHQNADAGTVVTSCTLGGLIGNVTGHAHVSGVIGDNVKAEDWPHGHLGANGYDSYTPLEQRLKQ